MSNIDRIINKEKFTELETKIPKVNNTLTSTSITEGLSANQGKVLNDKFSNYSTTEQTTALINSELAKVGITIKEYL